MAGNRNFGQILNLLSAHTAYAVSWHNGKVTTCHLTYTDKKVLRPVSVTRFLPSQVSLTLVTLTEPRLPLLYNHARYYQSVKLLGRESRQICFRVTLTFSAAKLFGQCN